MFGRRRRDELQQSEGQLGGPLARLHRPAALTALQCRGDRQGVRCGDPRPRVLRAPSSRPATVRAAASTRMRRRGDQVAVRGQAFGWLADEQARLYEPEGRAGLRRRRLVEKQERGEVRHTKETFGAFWERWLSSPQALSGVGNLAGVRARRAPAAHAGAGVDGAWAARRRARPRADGRMGRGDGGRRARAEDDQQHPGHACGLPERCRRGRPDRGQPGAAGADACRLGTSSASTCACTRSRSIWTPARLSTGRWQSC